MSYPTWGALLHMAMRHSCLNHKIDELSLVFSAKSEKSSPSLSRFTQASSSWLVTPYMYIDVLFHSGQVLLCSTPFRVWALSGSLGLSFLLHE
ncbi:hypothetical protein VNO77_32917 [Canavalia gladiata]|uniref:Uncharacterized protein n=1 Tax=Canavalia gladiata TaxID=3824 RepID=A0AAN9KAS4_CANGL